MKSNQKATTKMIWSYCHYYHWPKIDIKESSQPRKIKLSKKRTFAHAHITHIFGLQQKMLKLDKKSLSISNHRSLKAALSDCRALRNANRPKLNYDIEIYWKMMMMAMVMAKKQKTLVCYLTGVGWLLFVGICVELPYYRTEMANRAAASNNITLWNHKYYLNSLYRMLNMFASCTFNLFSVSDFILVSHQGANQEFN